MDGGSMMEDARREKLKRKKAERANRVADKGLTQNLH
jgi:hypothetical protein